MRTDDYDYALSEDLIAQVPLKQRDSCRLLYLNKSGSIIEHHIFKDLKKFLKQGDRLVFNNTKVIPARLYGKKENGVPIEFLFTEKINALSWKVIAKPAKRLKPDTIVSINGYESGHLHVVNVLDDGSRIVQLKSSNGDDLESILEKYGHFPLPPYITREDTADDRDDYQTVYASCKGAIAAPTAGLHFTDEMLDELKKSGINISHVTLHVGIGTFRPVKVDDPREHDIHEEAYEISEQTANEINATRASGGRIIAIGTTVIRVLEHCAKECGTTLKGMSGKTRLMILPPYTFRIVDGIVTNFHLPKSTLLMLVSAFAGREFVMNAYKEAVNKEYRFFSYGDAMLIMP